MQDILEEIDPQLIHRITIMPVHQDGSLA